LNSYTGIQNVHQLGQYDIEKNSKVLLRYLYFHTGIMRIAAGHLPARENWDLKLGLGRLVYEEAEAANNLRKRIAELRTSPAKLHQEPDAVLSLLMDELIMANNDLELLTAVYGCIKPAILETYRRHIASTQQLVDQPTIRILKYACMDIEEQIKWGKGLIEEISAQNLYPEGPEEFVGKIKEFLAAAGGIDGLQTKSTTIPWRWRSHEKFQLPLKAVRDPRKMGPSTFARTGVSNPPAEDPVKTKLYEMMRVRQEEMCASEVVAAVIYSQKNMPWEFYYESARHLWDEIRHTMFGQAALEAEGLEWMDRPQYTSDYDINAEKLPGVQYTWLAVGIEGGAMRKTGKLAEYTFCREEAKHPLMTQFQDYDWADEVVHAGFGRKWAPELLGDNLEYTRGVAQEELKHFWSMVGSAKEEWEQKKTQNK
jgi:hypothetical protein